LAAAVLIPSDGTRNLAKRAIWQNLLGIRMVSPGSLDAQRMLSLIRSFLGTWAARAFFIVLVGSFGLWGVADVVRNVGRDNAIATVGGHKIEAPEFQEAMRTQLAQVSRMLGGKTEPTPAIRQAVAGQVLDRLIVQAAIQNEVARLGLAVPDEALRSAVFDIPAFRGAGGAFDRQRFEAVLRNNNLSEPRFLELMRSDLGQRQLMEAIQVGAAPPETVTQQVFAFQRETRVAQYVELPFAAAAEPPVPTEADLQRFYDNNADRYSAPEFRRIKAVILSPETVARDIEVPAADISAYYEQHKPEYVTPEKRSVEVVVVQDEARAKEITTMWIAGADWDAMQKVAAATGASSASLDDATVTEFPSPELGQAVFAAPADAVTGPIQSALGWQVFRVTKVTAGAARTLDQATDEIRNKLARERAVDQVYARANKLEDALSASGSLDDLPGDLGVAAVTGTLNAQGNTPAGEPAPLPGSPALRQARLTAAEGPDQSYFAVTVEDATPAARKPFTDVEAQVRDDWVRDARRKEQERAAASLLAAAKAGSSLDDAATVAGLRLQSSPPVMRAQPTPGVPTEMVEPLFSMTPNEPTMIETPDAFYVVALGEVKAPDPASDPPGTAQIRTALTQAIGQDIEVTYAAVLRDRVKPQVNRTLLDNMAQP